LLKEWGLFPAMTDNRPILTAKPGTFRMYWDDPENQQKDDILLNGLGSPAISGQAWICFWRLYVEKSNGMLVCCLPGIYPS
jgi:hypothetical protein